MVLVHLNRRGLVFFPFWILLVFFCVLLAFFCVIEHQKNTEACPEGEGEEHQPLRRTPPSGPRPSG